MGQAACGYLSEDPRQATDLPPTPTTSAPSASQAPGEADAKKPAVELAGSQGFAETASPSPLVSQLVPTKNPSPLEWSSLPRHHLRVQSPGKEESQKRPRHPRG